MTKTKQSPSQAVQKALNAAQSKTAAAKPTQKKQKALYGFINVRVPLATKEKMTALAHTKKQSLSQAVARLIEWEVLGQTHPKTHIPADQDAQNAPHPFKRIDPTLTLTTEEIKAYERPQWLAAGKPIARDPWYVRLLSWLSRPFR